MSDAFTNPVTTGLVGGGCVLVVQLVWNRVVGSDQKSIPVQLAEIFAQLASIQSTLLLIKNDAGHAQRNFEELKEDFWNHINNEHHGGIDSVRASHRNPRNTPST
jgi:hypothetical protein